MSACFGRVWAGIIADRLLHFLLGRVGIMILDAPVVLDDGDDDLNRGERDPSGRDGVGQAQIKDLVGLLGKSVGENIYAVLHALICDLHDHEEEVRDAEDHRHRPAAGQQASHQTQVVQPHQCASPFEGAHELLVPEGADEEGGVDAAGLREVGAEAEHAAEGFPQEPASGEVRHGVGQVHQVVGDEVGQRQVDEEDLVGADAGPLRRQGARDQQAVPHDPCQEHESPDDGLNQLLGVHCFSSSACHNLPGASGKVCVWGRGVSLCFMEEDVTSDPIKRLSVLFFRLEAFVTESQKRFNLMVVLPSELPSEGNEFVVWQKEKKSNIGLTNELTDP